MFAMYEVFIRMTKERKKKNIFIVDTRMREDEILRSNHYVFRKLYKVTFAVCIKAP